MESEEAQEIRAKGDALAKKLEARSQLHPAAQIVDTLGDKIGSIISNLGCFIVIVIIILAIAAPTVLQKLFGG